MKPAVLMIAFVALLITGCSASKKAPDAPLPDESAAPSTLVGHWDVSGSDGRGNLYRGELTIKPGGPVLDMAWKLPEEKRGIGLPLDDLLVAAWGEGRCYLMVYQQHPAGYLQGVWYVGGQQDLGAERAQPTEIGKDLVGTYTVTGANPDGTIYHSQLTVTSRGKSLQFSWRGDGVDAEGVGLALNDLVAVVWGDLTCGITIYQLDESGALVGNYAYYGRPQLGRRMPFVKTALA